MLLSMCGPDLLTYLTPPFSLITLPSSMMLWRALYHPPVGIPHSARYQSNERDSLTACESVKQKLTV